MLRKTVLDNGIRVISEAIGHVRSISIGVWVACGSRLEDGATNGTAHFIEHMLFKGTEKRSAFDIAAAIDSVGGVMNAFTSKELTSFYIKIPDYHLPLAIDLLADIFLHSRFAREDIEKEKSVVLQEINLTEDTPDDYIQEFLEAQFWNGHRLGQPILGDRGSVAHFSREGVVDFFGRHYRAGRVVVTAAGRVDHDDLVARVQEAFGAMEDVAAVKADDGEPRGVAKAAVLERQLEQVHLMLATMAPSVVSEQRYSSFLLNAVLGGSMSSRLFQEIREKRALAYAISSFLAPYGDAGMFNVYAGTAPRDVREVLGLILDEMARMQTTPLRSGEINGAKEFIKGNFLLSMESTDTRMTRLAKNEMFFGRQLSFEEVVAGIDAVSPGDIQLLAMEMFRPETMAVAAIGPVSQGDLAWAVGGTKGDGG